MTSLDLAEAHDDGLLVGGRLNQLVLIERLAVQATGAVYKARHSVLSHRFVALKVASPDMAQPPATSSPLEREARLIHRVRHPSVLEVHDVGMADGRMYMIMECVEGRRIDDVLRSGPLNDHQILVWAHQIAEALAAIHASGVGLGGVNDGSIVVLHDHSIKVVDFSAAVELDSAALPVDGGSAYRNPGETAARLDVRGFGTLLQRLLDRCPASSTARLRAGLLGIARECAQEGARSRLMNGSGIVTAIKPLVRAHLDKRRYGPKLVGAIGGAALLLLLGGAAVTWRIGGWSAGAEQHSFVVVRRGPSPGCAIDRSVALKASAYVPTPAPSDRLRFYVLRSDETPWPEPGQLRLFVGDGPSCGAKPHNVTKEVVDVEPGKSVQVIDLDVRQYDGKWSVGEEKTFWIGASAHGLDAYRASNPIVIKRLTVP